MTAAATAGSPLMTSDSEEWYTPRHIIEAVLQVLREIDLDPASPAHPTIPARRHFTKEEDGLLQRWHGRVYLNPPYGRGVDTWIEKALLEYREGAVTEAIILVAARTDTKWFNRLKDYPWCSVEGRLKFSSSKNSAPFPSAVFYLGDDAESFVKVFGEIGAVWLPAGEVKE